MRQQVVWLKIVALFALVSMILPASVQAALCRAQPMPMKCCMAPKAVVVKTEPVHSCCASKQPKSSGPTIKSDDHCHCVVKSLPAQNPNEGAIASFVVNPDLQDQVAIVSFANLGIERAQHFESNFIAGDSSPPRSPELTTSPGRAPPVS